MKCSRLFIVACVMFSAGVVAGVSAQQQRYALVIGNAEYTSVTPLRNPVNDADAIARELKGVGFSVTLLTNAGLAQMDNAVVRFGDQLQGANGSVGFFYYAGHGVQAGGQNYLIPIDANIPSQAFLAERSLALQSVMSTLDTANDKLNIVVLDACRDNPFSWSRGLTRGLTVVGAQPPNSIIAYSAGAGQVAQDGTGNHGIYTGKLLKYLDRRGLDIFTVFRDTGAAVSSATDGSQVPAIYDQFFGRFYLAGRPEAVRTASAASPSSTSTEAARSPHGTASTVHTPPSSRKSAAATHGSTALASSSPPTERALPPAGTVWTEHTLPSSQNWQSVAYGNGTFVAVAADSDVVATSTDGVNWTAATLPSSQNWQSVTYGNGTFLAVALNSDVVATSSFGVSWTEATLPSSQFRWSVTYDNDTFVAVSARSDVVATSSDGVNWTQSTLPSYQSWSSVAYGNSTFVAIAAGSDIVATTAIDTKLLTGSTFQQHRLYAGIDVGQMFLVAIASRAASNGTGLYVPIEADLRYSITRQFGVSGELLYRNENWAGVPIPPGYSTQEIGVAVGPVVFSHGNSGTFAEVKVGGAYAFGTFDNSQYTRLDLLIEPELGVFKQLESHLSMVFRVGLQSLIPITQVPTMSATYLGALGEMAHHYLPVIDVSIGWSGYPKR